MDKLHKCYRLYIMNCYPAWTFVFQNGQGGEWLHTISKFVLGFPEKGREQSKTLSTEVVSIGGQAATKVFV